MRNNHVMRGLLIIMLALSFISGLAQEKSDFPDGLIQGFEYYKAGDMKNAAEHLEKALPLVEKYSERYELVLDCLGMAYMELNDMKNIRRIMALMDEHNQYQLSLPCEEVGCMVERAEYYAAIGENVTAKSWYLKALGLPVEKEEAYLVHSSYGKFLGTMLKDYAQAADYCHTAAIIRASMGLKDEEYASVLYSAALYLYYDNQNEKAVDAYEQVIDFFNPHKDNKSARKNIALCMEGIARSYFVLREFRLSHEFYLEAMKYYESEDASGEKYPKLVANVAMTARYMEDYDTAISYYQKALALFDERGMLEDYSSASASLNICYSLAGVDASVTGKEEEIKMARAAKLDQIISEEKESLELTRMYFGELSYARSLATIAGCYSLKEEYSSAVDYYEQYMQCLRGALQYEFRMQNESERMIIWEREQETLQQAKEMLLLLPEGSEAEFVRLAAFIYDAELLLKGMLLNSSIEFESVINGYADAALSEKYRQTKDNEAEIARLRSAPSSENDLEKILRLTEKNRELQMEIYEKCTEYKDYTEYISYSWQDVRKVLQPGDLAIEFSIVRTGLLQSDATLVAFLLDTRLMSPVAVPVCSLPDAELLGAYEGLFDADWPGEMIWGQMRPLIDGKTRIFFSADGVFNKVGIEYLQYDGAPFSEQYEVYRVSSTKELCRPKQDRTVRTADIFGSIDYDGYGYVDSEGTQKRAAVTEGIYMPLESTSYEISNISGILESAGVTPHVYSEGEADEEAFLALDGNGVGILHIATHGVCGSEDGMSAEEAMNKSFLVFAGANSGEDADGNDGLITAAEVATMNLRGCDLAVLSACETGLGALGADGIFGLQRGFKNAGVKTLFMSLKEVYDHSTAEMMVRFYRHLMSGESKREALVNAQKELRSLGYTDSDYWATFILLDAF